MRNAPEQRTSARSDIAPGEECFIRNGLSAEKMLLTAANRSIYTLQTVGKRFLGTP